MAAADRVLGWRPQGTTDCGWASLALFRDHLRGRLARMRDPIRFDKDGHPVKVQRHRAGSNGKRPAVFRFPRG